VPARLLLGHRIDPQHVTYFPHALAVADSFGVRSDPAYLLVAPDGRLLFKHVGRIAKDALVAAIAQAAHDG